MSKREWVLTTLVGTWLVLFCLVSFHMTIVLWGPAIEFSRYEGSQDEQLDDVREVLDDAGSQGQAVNDAAEAIEEVQESIAAGDESAAGTALDEVEQAVEAAEDALADLADETVGGSVASAESALQNAQESLDVVGSDAATTDEAMEVIEAAEDAVEEAEGAVGQAAVTEARTMLRSPPRSNVRILWLFDWTATEEVLLLGLALAGAGVGISAGALSAITRLVGVREFKSSWLSWHAARPLWGLAAATIGYAAIRGGLLNINNSAAALNPFAVYAIGAVFGLNSSDGLAMLRGVLRPTSKPELLAGDEDSDSGDGDNGNGDSGNGDSGDGDNESEVADEPPASIEPAASGSATADVETRRD